MLTGVTGDTEGIVLYSMNSRDCKNIASELIGSPVPLYDQMAESALPKWGTSLLARQRPGLNNGVHLQTVASSIDHR
ncbi:MAG: hypothetical protein ACOX34_02110 [Bacillota bacterium]